MNYWLIKSEPYVFSYEQLQADGKAVWDGVRNYQARNNLRAMAAGDLALFYHSNEGLAVVGIAEVVAEAYPDPTATAGDWSVVEVVPYRALRKPVPLSLIKATPALQELGLVKNPRLSVMPVSSEAFSIILALGETEI
jgi:predicted RNA-binding protein with PUA-like domain